MQLVDLVSLAIDQQASELELPAKGQSAIRDDLDERIQELSIECIHLGMGAEVATALRRLTQPMLMGF